MKTLLLLIFTPMFFFAQETKQKLEGRYKLPNSECAGLEFKLENIVIGYNELSCENPAEMQITWLDNKTFILRETKVESLDCPYRIHVYKIISLSKKELRVMEYNSKWIEKNAQTKAKDIELVREVIYLKQ